LRLPRFADDARGSRNPALSDPRANTVRLGLGERMARTIGSDERLLEEARGDGRRRVRQGTTCLDVHPSRAGVIDPIGQSERPNPALVGAC
jgi:hypothetical protein